MSTQVQHRRGTAAQHEAFTGAMSEITHDTTRNSIRVHDGITEGGHATLMESEKGIAGGVAPLDADTLIPEEFLLNAPVGDGSVTDPKLPNYDPGTSPSAAKIRFMASTSSGAIAGAVSRPLDAKLSESLHAADFGVKADGISDDTTAMVAAFAAMQNTGRPLFLPRGTILVEPDTLVLGDGSVSGASTYQCCHIVGSGFAPYTRSGTVIKAKSNGTLLLEIKGLIEGVSFLNVQFDCAGLVNRGIDATALTVHNWDGFGIYDWLDNGMRFLNRNEPYPISVTWSCNNQFRRFFITSAYNRVYSSGLYFSGEVDLDNPPGPHDMHRSIFENGVIQMNKVPETDGCQAIFFGFVDSSQFREVDTIMIGSGKGYSATFSDQDNVGLPYPQNLLFIGCSLGGDAPRTIGSPGNNYFFHYAQKDGESLPADRERLRGFTDDGLFFGPHQIEKLTDALSMMGPTAAARTIRFETPDGTSAAKLVHNSSLGLEMQVWNGSSYATLMRWHPNGKTWVLVPDVGFREITAGSVDSAGAGFRYLRVQN